MRRVIVGFAVVLVGLALAAAWYVQDQYRCLTAPQAGTDALAIVVERGDSLRDVVATLTNSNALSCPNSWYWYSRYRKVDRQLKAGEYSIPAGASGVAILEQLVAGDVVTHSITLVEGWTSAQALATIRAHPMIRSTLPADADASVWLEAIAATESHLEGLFFPSTYFFERGATDVEIAHRAYQQQQSVLADVWSERAEDIPLTSDYEALILASIIEKETARDDERRQIAGVFTRRLQKGMRLQTDPTVIYGMGDNYDGDIRRRDLTTDTPYNTYTRAGLTPTPIALAGRASLQAAVDPAPGDTYYFVATGENDGSHYFSRTNEEHEAAVQRYLKRLREQRTNR